MRISLLAAALVLAPPLARACDTEYLNSQLTLVCRAALDPALTLLQGLAPQATAAEAACETGDPEVGAQEAIRLARLAGRIEARLPEPPAIWPTRQAAR